MNTNKNYANRWELVDTQGAEQSVHRVQCKIYEHTRNNEVNEANKLQKRLLASYSARVTAVRIITEHNKGKSSPGVDGVASLSGKQKMELAQSIRIDGEPSPVLLKIIPKKGSDKGRPLGIPTIEDRVRQLLILFALEPQWEARYPETMFGFRKGRGTQDARAYLQLCLRKSPKYVFDADVEKFFERIDHKSLLYRIDAPEVIRVAIRKTLKAGISIEGGFQRSEAGTPQGGPLSPLLANIALTGLVDHVHQQYKKTYQRHTELPRVIIYADDLVVLHKNKEVIRASESWVQGYLSGIGLNLNPKKTKVCHTLQIEGGGAGFDFLATHFQHHMVREKGGEKRPYLLSVPSKKAQTSLYGECADMINKSIMRKKHRTRRVQQGKDPVEALIRRLNKKMAGWGNYHRSMNSKDTFSRIDSLLHDQLWRWTKKQFKGKKRQWMVDRLFSGVETDKDGLPLQRVDGSLRERSWAFKSPFKDSNEQHATLMKLADVRITRPTMVRIKKSFYDNDWPYWGQRNHRGRRYPGIPEVINASALKRSRGKCSLCGDKLHKGDVMSLLQGDRESILIHQHCSRDAPLPHR